MEEKKELLECKYQAGAPSGDPYEHGETMQTPHRRDGGSTRDLLAVRPQC